MIYKEDRHFFWMCLVNHRYEFEITVVQEQTIGYPKFRNVLILWSSIGLLLSLLIERADHAGV